MSIPAIFSYSDYRDYVRATLSQPPFGRGAQAQLAKFLDCQPSFISQILNGKNELSLEHAHRMNLYFQHRPVESEYFLSMVLLSKAGSPELIRYYQEHLERIRKQATAIDSLVSQDELEEQDIMNYYSRWTYLAIHMLVTIPRFQNKEALSKKLNLTETEFLEAIEFLTRTGLVEKSAQGTYLPGRNQIHLKKSSSYSKFAATMMRLKTLESLDMSHEANVNYSANFTVSSQLFEQLKKRIKEVILELNSAVGGDAPEKLCTLTIDLMEH